MLNLCYCYNTYPMRENATTLVLRTVEEITSASKKMRLTKWPEGGYILVIRPPRMTPLVAFGSTEYTDTLKRLIAHFRHLPERLVSICYPQSFDVVSAPLEGIDPARQIYSYEDKTTGVEVNFPTFSVFDTERDAIGLYLCEFFDSISVHFPTYNYTITDPTEGLDHHFRDLTKLVTRAADLEKLATLSAGYVKPLAGVGGKLAMVYFFIDRYNRRWMVRMPTTPVTRKDLPRIAEEFNLPNLEAEVAKAVIPHHMLPWGYWYNEISETAQ